MNGAEQMFILKNTKNSHNSRIFQERPMISHINRKLSPRKVGLYGWTYVYLEK